MSAPIRAEQIEKGMTYFDMPNTTVVYVMSVSMNPNTIPEITVEGLEFSNGHAIPSTIHYNREDGEIYPLYTDLTWRS